MESTLLSACALGNGRHQEYRGTLPQYLVYANPSVLNIYLLAPPTANERCPARAGPPLASRPRCKPTGLS
jgi:hypothetical protein